MRDKFSKASLLTRNRGFTFIELLVVMFIISLVTLVITFNTVQPNTTRDINSFATLLKSQMEVAREEAILQMSVISLRLNKTGYEFYQLRETDEAAVWEPLEISDPFWHSYKIPSRLILEFKPQRLKEPQSHSDLNKNTLTIVFFPSGEISPFGIKIRSENTKLGVELIGKTNGDLSLEKNSNE